jgi:hypothetical protein
MSSGVRPRSASFCNAACDVRFSRGDPRISPRLANPVKKEEASKTRHDAPLGLLAAKCQFSAATPACETTSSCEPLPPLTPIAPINLPPTTSGLPPREAITSSSVVR